ncbi:hypothetical protein ACEPAI_1280 [Sanghuangporus weigelae]
MAKQSVLIIGATGITGSSIVNGLLEDSGNFHVIAAVRPSSTSKPQVGDFKSRGVEIRILYLENRSVDQIAEPFQGVDIVISTIYITEILRQKVLVDACKKAGVKRFIPDDWAIPSIRGVRKLGDEKLVIRDYVKESGIGYTFIDVGWWMQLSPPFMHLIDKAKVPYPRLIRTYGSRFGTGDVKCAVTDSRDIGKFVARIIVDERTLNRYVFCWVQEVTQNELFAIAERVFGHKIDIGTFSEEERLDLLHHGADTERNSADYVYSLWIRGDNTVENAKKEEYGGALDAKELYPDLGEELRTLEDYAKELLAAGAVF